MNKRIVRFDVVAFLLALCLVPALRAQQKAAPAAAQTRHTLWKIQGQHNTVYLLGSVHVLKDTDYPLPAVIESAFTNTQIAAFETDISALEDPSLALKMMAKAKLPEGQTLQSQVSAPVYKSFTNHIESAGWPAMMFEPFTAPMAAMTLAVLEIQKLGLDPDNGVDKHFYKLARKDGKQIVALETVDFQMGLLTDFTKEEGELLLKTTLKEMDNMKKELADMVKAWQTGDAAQLEKLLNEAMQEAPSIYKRLVTDRSRSWVPKITELAGGEKNAIVIVGAGHLVGKDGVVELLKQKGLKVTQM